MDDRLPSNPVGRNAPDVAIAPSVADNAAAGATWTPPFDAVVGANDAALEVALRRALQEDAATAGQRVEVVVHDGVAHLRGRVDGLEDIDNVTHVAARVPGVRDVVDELTLQPPISASTSRTDAPS